MTSVDAQDPWEANAGWWQDEFTDGADPEYEEQIIPLCVEHLRGCDRVLDVGTGEGQIARVLAGLGASVVGVDPTLAQVVVARDRAGGPAYARAGAAALPIADASVDAAVACLVFEHIDDVDDAIAEIARVLVPGGRFVFLLNHPLLQTPGSGWIDDHILEEQYWRIGPYLVEDSRLEEVEKDVFIPFIHRPLSRYLNALAANGLLLTHMEEPAPPAGFVARAEEYAEAASIPRLLLLRTEKLASTVAELVVIAGLSGAGRSTAANAFEDLGWYVIDNLPPSLLPQVVDLTRRAAKGDQESRVVLVVNRTPGADELLVELQRLRSDGEEVTLIFLDAPDDVLVRRFEDKRRKHPISSVHEPLAIGESILVERGLLSPLKDAADLVIDTAELNVHQLRDRLVELFTGERPKESMAVTLISFGFKHGIPLDADMVLDVRFLPNPHWVPALRPLSGRDDPVRDHVLGEPMAQEFLVRVDSLLELLLPAYVTEGKAYLTIAIGCTGGRHRSVAIAQELARRIGAHGHQARVVHRDADRRTA